MQNALQTGILKEREFFKKASIVKGKIGTSFKMKHLIDKRYESYKATLVAK